MNYAYLPFYNSPKTAERYINQLTPKQLKKLMRMLARLEKDLNAFDDKSDVAYSIIKHVIDGKLEVKEETTVKTVKILKMTEPNDQPVPAGY